MKKFLAISALLTLVINPVFAQTTINTPYGGFTLPQKGKPAVTTPATTQQTTTTTPAGSSTTTTTTPPQTVPVTPQGQTVAPTIQQTTTTTPATPQGQTVCPTTQQTTTTTPPQTAPAVPSTTTPSGGFQIQTPYGQIKK